MKAFIIHIKIYLFETGIKKVVIVEFYGRHENDININIQQTCVT